MLDLKDKIILITGGSQGIGKDIVEFLSECGATMCICDRSSKDRGIYVDKDAKKFTVEKVDVSSEDAVKRGVNTVFEKHGRIDVLINNAGIVRDRLGIRMSEDEWEAVLNVNLKGAFLMSREVLKVMSKARCGKIINISSIIGLVGNVGQGNYSASKAGLIALTKSLAMEMGGRNITVNAIAPGFIRTEMSEVLIKKAGEQMLKKIPLNRFGEGKDIANMALYLSSSLSDYITGQVFVIDGGLTMTG